MCEIPNNVIRIDAFAELFDGFSIGSNDLTQLTLGVDRDSEIVAFDFDERDPGMMEMLRLAVTGAKRNGRHVGICGEAPANYPEIAAGPGGLGHRLDQRQSGEPDQRDQGRGRSRTTAAARRRGMTAGSNQRPDHAVVRQMPRMRSCRKLGASIKPAKAGRVSRDGWRR